MDKYTVWVGGVEVNDHYLDKEEAERLAEEWEEDEYDDVVIEKVSEEEREKRKKAVSK